MDIELERHGADRREKERINRREKKKTLFHLLSSFGRELAPVPTHNIQTL